MYVQPCFKYLPCLFRRANRYVCKRNLSRVSGESVSTEICDDRPPEKVNNFHDLKIESYLPEPVLDLDYICDPENTKEISENIVQRKSGGDISKIFNLLKEINLSPHSRESLKKQLQEEALKVPNKSFSGIKHLSKPNVIYTHGQKHTFDFTPLDLETLSEHWGLLRLGYVGKLSSPRAYYLRGALAELEQALIRYTVDVLVKEGFSLFSVPDLIHPAILEGCGMPTKGERTQVFHLHPNYYGLVSLAGTAEMALAGMFVNNKLSFDSLPNKLASVSRCYRAEKSSSAAEHGIYRVHEFYKVEMFALTEGDEKISEAMLKEFVSLQKTLFSNLNLHFQVLSMPPNELGASAYHKIDIEAWMPGRNIYGEISSASNCTDYQSRRLSMKYMDRKGKECFVHTVNGTACAIPRTLIAILEQCQAKDRSILIPSVLWPYTDGLKCINASKPPKMYWSKHMKSSTTNQK